MKILKFKLINDGTNGISVEGNEYLKSEGNFVLVDNVKRQRNLILPTKLKDEVAKLKYFFLNLTGHWAPSFAKYYDEEEKTLLAVTKDSDDLHLFIKDLWNRTTVTGANLKDGRFLITGKIEVIEGKTIGIATPLISMDDDIGFYDDCMTVLDGIGKLIADYFRKGIVSLEEHASKMSKASVDGKTKEEITEMVLQDLQEKGAIIMMSSAGMIDSSAGLESVEIHTKTGSIDGGSIKAATIDEEDIAEYNPEEEADDEKEMFAPEKVDVFGTPAAKIPTDKEEPSGIPDGDVARYEHSENFGEHTDDNNPDTEGDGW